MSLLKSALLARVRNQYDYFIFLRALIVSPAFRKTPQARRITAPAPNPPYIAQGWRRYPKCARMARFFGYPKTGFHFAAINKTIEEKPKSPFFIYRPSIKSYQISTSAYSTVKKLNLSISPLVSVYDYI